MPTRFIPFGGSTVAARATDPAAGAVLDFLFANVPDKQNGSLTITYYLDVNPWQVRTETRILRRGISKAAAAELLLGQTCLRLAAESRGGLLFHAAVVAFDGRAILMPGATGAGKTTLTAFLLSRGLSYLSDELAFVPRGASTVEALPRPLNVKSSARAALRPYLNLEQASAHRLSAPQFDLLAPAFFGDAPPGLAAPLAAIVFPCYWPGSAGKWQPLSKAQAGLALMQAGVNARNLPQHGFDEVARLARLVPAYRAEYQQFEQVWPHLCADILLKS